MSTFTEFKLLPAIQKNIDALGFTTPTEIQEKIIPLLLANLEQDVHAQAQTGTGKTLAFGIPLLHAIDPKLKAVQGLVIAPTRELVLQIYESLRDIARDTGISIEPIYGGMSITRQIDAIKRGAHIIIGTPGRLNDHLRRKTLNLDKLKVLVLDEADIMLDMGFREEVDTILNAAPENRQIWLFSATVGSGIQQLIKSHMHDVLSVKAATKQVVGTKITQYYCLVPVRNRTSALARFIEAAPDFYGIIFCKTKLLATEVTEQLASKGFKINSLHGDMKQELRNRVIKGFKNRDFTILVATDVAARGIDVSDLTHVINYSIPEEIESYVHRIGRTGRAGKEGIAITFASSNELYRLRRLEKIANTKLQEIPVPPLEAIINAKIDAVPNFIETAKQIEAQPNTVRKVLGDLINSFTEKEIKDALVLALEDKFFKDIIHEDLSDVKPSTAPQEICMELGQFAGINEDQVRNYLYTTCKLLPQDIQKVRVLKKQTYISIPENRLQSCMQAMKETPLVDTPHKIYLVEDVYREKRNTGSRGGRQDTRDRRDRWDRRGGRDGSRKSSSKDRKYSRR